jgi:hypothetical protein
LNEVVSRELDRAFEQATEDTYQDLTRTVPIDTGVLAANTQVRSFGGTLSQGWTGEAVAGTTYAAYLDTPSPAEYIVPKRAQVLRFTDRRGRTVYAKRVRVSRKHEDWFSGPVYGQGGWPGFAGHLDRAI